MDAPAADGERHTALFFVDTICAYKPERGVRRRAARSLDSGAYLPSGCGSAAAISATICESNNCCSERSASSRNPLSSTIIITPKNTASGIETEMRSRWLRECTDQTPVGATAPIIQASGTDELSCGSG